MPQSDYPILYIYISKTYISKNFNFFNFNGASENDISSFNVFLIINIFALSIHIRVIQMECFKVLLMYI